MSNIIVNIEDCDQLVTVVVEDSPFFGSERISGEEGNLLERLPDGLYAKTPNADEITVEDGGEYFRGDSVEEALQEVGGVLPLKANLDSPSFSGDPTAPTPPSSSSSTSIATTEYVVGKIGEIDSGVASVEVEAPLQNVGTSPAPIISLPVATTSSSGAMSAEYVAKLGSVEEGAQVNTVNSVAGRVGEVVLSSDDVGLGSVDNTSDADKPVSTAQAAALATKVDKVEGKGLSTNDYTTAEKNKLAGISPNATQNSTDAFLLDRSNHTGTDPISSVEGLQGALEGKVDKEAGKQLSDENFTAAEKTKLASVESGAQVNTVTSVAGRTGNVTVTQTDVGLSNVDNTSDMDKPVSTSQQQALDGKVDTRDGYSLSQENFTPDEKSKLASLESSRWKGEFVSLEALQAAYPTAEAGDYADVDVPNEDVVRYIWDNSDTVWVAQSGVVPPLTAAQVKQLYESNPDTNAFSDSDEDKLDGIQVGATANQTDAFLLNRGNHTGSQDISTVSGLQNSLDNKAGLSEFNQLSSNVDTLSSNVSTLTTDVTSLSTSVSSLTTDVSQLQTQVGDIGLVLDEINGEEI